jgi:spore coat polysaccharide biosynthesis protein SpsF
MDKLQNNKTVAFVVARLSSSRLPAKQFRTIGYKSILDWITDELKKSKELAEIVITTASEPANEPLREYAKEHDISCFWYEGDVNHLTTRLRKAAEYHNAEISVMISADCPLISAKILDLLIRELKNSADKELIHVNPDNEGNHPMLEGIIISRLRAWQRADDLADRPELREHQFPVIFLNPELFTFKEVILPPEYYFKKHRFSVDTYADLVFMNTIYDELKNQGDEFNLLNVSRLLKEKPYLMEINSHVKQRALIENEKKALFITDISQENRFYDLKNNINLAHRIIEKLSWPVNFMFYDPESLDVAEKEGFKCFLEDKNYNITELINKHDLLIIDVSQNELPSKIKDFNKGKIIGILSDKNQKPAIFFDKYLAREELVSGEKDNNFTEILEEIYKAVILNH